MIVVMLSVAQLALGQWHTKWHEVSGEATIVLANSKDIHDDINVSAKKKLVMDATLDALQNAINLRLNPVISTQAYKTILEKDYLTINDHLIDLLAQQEIIWQRQQSPIFVQDDQNPKKWTVMINGLVKKANTEVPSAVVAVEKPKRTEPQVQPEPEVIEQSVPVQPQLEEVVVKKKKKRDFTRYLLGIQAGVTYDMPGSMSLDNGDFMDLNDGLGYRVGVRLPLARNFVIGADYLIQDVELGQEYGYGGPHSGGSHRWGGHGGNHRGGYGGGWEDFDATHYATMTGFGFSMGTLRNVINPSIGAFYQRGDVAEWSTDAYAGEILKRGATFGLDFGRGRVKLGVDATAYWLNATGDFAGFGSSQQPTELLSDVNWGEVNWRFGVNLKLFL